ncbi:unnamed protein product [Pleuronectes platessa]|uniref:Uncharacterized protein n=1 Tax=Pleuronectes platessa TaxID=8262 RepID=A0A9N7Z1D2_PLEPL|nr:unnamed protein product [Pleuronectes platessa]
MSQFHRLNKQVPPAAKELPLNWPLIHGVHTGTHSTQCCHFSRRPSFISARVRAINHFRGRHFDSSPVSVSVPSESSSRTSSGSSIQTCEDGHGEGSATAVAITGLESGGRGGRGVGASSNKEVARGVLVILTLPRVCVFRRSLGKGVALNALELCLPNGLYQ